MATTKDEVRKRAHNFRGANREFSQEMPPLVDGLLELIEDAEGPEVVDSLTSNSTTKALSANQGKVLKTLVDAKVDTPESTGEPGQVLQLDANGDPDWVTPSAGTTPDSVMSDDSTNAIQNKVVKKYVDDTAAEKANIDGYYASLVSGAAENLVGHGSVPAEYIFRTSGGDADLGTGTAKITKMKGNSIVWNQLVQNGNFADGATGWTYPSDAAVSVADGVITLNLDASGSTQQLNLTKSNFPYVTGHKYFILAFVKCNNASTQVALIPTGTTADGYVSAAYYANWTPVAMIWTRVGTSASLQVRGNNATDPSADIDFSVKYFMCIDLTLEFGAGNEPATIAEFQALYPLLYYAYTAGVIVNNGAAKIKTTGFNQWDEVAEVGNISGQTGEKVAEAGRIRTKNYIPVFGGVNYYMQIPSPYLIRAFYYDADKNYIGGESGFNAAGIRTTPSNCAYMMFAVSSSYGDTYNNNICINLFWSGYKNGEYHAHWEEEKELNIKTITGVAAGGSESEVIFPEGMRRAGTAYDELVVDSDGWARKAIKRIGVVDLGDLTYNYNAEDERFTASLPLVKLAGAVVCSNYVSATASAIVGKTIDKAVAISGSSAVLMVRDTAYTDADTFAAAMDGVGLNYELAEPVEYSLDEPIYMGYRVDDFGTEERLPADTASEVQAPITYEVQYAMNAVDTIRRLPQNYISKSSFDNFCTELSTKLGTALGKTITIDADYNTETQEYDYDITIADAESQSAGGNESE
jgi:hypothetical protein